MIYLATVLWAQGYADQAAQRGREAVTTARALDDPAALATAWISAILQHMLRREYGAALQAIGALEGRLRGVGLTQAHDWAEVLCGWAQVRQGTMTALSESFQLPAGASTQRFFRVIKQP